MTRFPGAFCHQAIPWSEVTQNYQNDRLCDGDCMFRYPFRRCTHTHFSLVDVSLLEAGLKRASFALSGLSLCWPCFPDLPVWEYLFREAQVIILSWVLSRKYSHWRLYSCISPLPIYTLRIFTGRIYVVNNARLASEVQRKSKTFSFDPFVILAAERLAGTTSHGLALIREDSDGDCHLRGLVADSHERFHKILNSSSCLESMSCDMAANIATALSNLASTSDSVVNLSQWMKRTISVASTNAVYGPLNPFAIDSRVYDAFWLVRFRLHTTLLF